MVNAILTGVSDWDRCGRRATIALATPLAVKYTDDVPARETAITVNGAGVQPRDRRLGSLLVKQEHRRPSLNQDCANMEPLNLVPAPAEVPGHRETKRTLTPDGNFPCRVCPLGYSLRCLKPLS